MFSTLSRVRMMSSVLSQLNVLCTSLVKPYYFENDDSPVIITVHTLRPFYVFSDVLDFIEAECSIYQNVQYFIRSKNCVLIWPQLDILCRSAVKRYYAKNDNSPFKGHLFSHVLEFMEARKTCHRVDRTSVCSISYSGELCNKNCIVKTAETLIVWSASG